MVQVAVDRIVTAAEIATRLREILETTTGEQFWVIADGGRPRLAIVDLEYLNDLIRRAWFDDLATETQTAFREYLRLKGLDPDTVTEE